MHFRLGDSNDHHNDKSIFDALYNGIWILHVKNNKLWQFYINI